MKHKYLYILPALAILFGFSACSTDDVTTDSQPVGNKVIVKAGIGEGSIFTRSNPVGTEDEQKNFNANDQINISDGNKSVNYTYDGTTWNPTNSGEFLTWHSDNVTFKAFYPASKIGDEDNTFEVGHVMTDQKKIEDINASDFMTVTQTLPKEPTDHTLGLQFQRKTARVIVNIVDYKNQFDGVDKRIGMYIMGKPSSNSNELNDLEWIKSYESTPNKQFVTLVFPIETQPNTDFLSFDFLDDKGKEREDIETLWYTGIPKLEAGKSYTFNVTLGSDKVTLESVSVEDWATGDPIGKGEATEQFVPNVNLSEMTAEQLTNWLNTNSERLKNQTITLTGAWKDEFYAPFRNFLKIPDTEESANITLDLSNVTGMSEIKGNGEGFVSDYSESESNHLKSSLAGIILPSMVNTIGSHAFLRTQMKSIDLTNVTSIGSSAFAETKIESITIPPAITEINESMLFDMSYLKTVTFEGEVREIGHNVFGYDTALETINLSNCNGLPDIAQEAFGKEDPTGKITVIVKDEERKHQFQNQPEWSRLNFLEFKVKGE